MTRHIPYLDGWRGLAIACLLAGHFFPIPGMNLGTIGVALFFVLSGLLMSRVLFLQNMNIGVFYRRRIARVFPSVAVYLTAVTGLYLAMGLEFDAAELLTALTFTNNYFVTDHWTMPFGHIWSLSVEEHSYVILSLAALWCRSKGGRGIAAVGLILAFSLASIAIYAIFFDEGSSHFTLRTEVASFGIFASGFLMLLSAHRRIRLENEWIAPLALAVGIGCHWWSIPAAVKIGIGWGALAISINTMQYAVTRFARFFELVWLRKLGLYSFSLYLWQQPFYQLYRHHGLHPGLGLMLSLGAGYAAFHLVEHPLRSYLNTHWRAQPATAVTPDCRIARPDGARADGVKATHPRDLGPCRAEGL
ncbi:acyltransferase [Massilia sp. UMI-21]|nr:acyltransferase [Massilia sp. UMI-21]